MVSRSSARVYWPLRPQSQIVNRQSSIVNRQSSIASPHGVGALRNDLIEDPHLIGLAKGVFVHIQVLFSHLVDVGISPLLGDLGDFAANAEVAVRILRVHDRESDFGIPPHVAVFYSSLG